MIRASRQWRRITPDDLAFNKVNSTTKSRHGGNDDNCRHKFANIAISEIPPHLQASEGHIRGEAYIDFIQGGGYSLRAVRGKPG